MAWTDIAQAVGTCTAAVGTVSALAFYGWQVLEVRKEARDANCRWEEELEFQYMPRLALSNGGGHGQLGIQTTRFLVLDVEGQGMLFDVALSVEGPIAGLSFSPDVPRKVGVVRAGDRPQLLEVTWSPPTKVDAGVVLDVVLDFENARDRRWEWRQQITLGSDLIMTGAPRRRKMAPTL